MNTESGYYVESSSPLDSALFFVLAAFILNLIVVFLAFCYFDPPPEPPLINRTYKTLRRLNRSSKHKDHQLVIKEPEDTEAVLFV